MMTGRDCDRFEKLSQLKYLPLYESILTRALPCSIDGRFGIEINFLNIWLKSRTYSLTFLVPRLTN